MKIPTFWSQLFLPRVGGWTPHNTVDGWNPKQPPGMVLKPYKKWDILHINWCRISAINSITGVFQHGCAAGLGEISLRFFWIKLLWFIKPLQKSLSWFEVWYELWKNITPICCLIFFCDTSCLHIATIFFPSKHQAPVWADWRPPWLCYATPLLRWLVLNSCAFWRHFPPTWRIIPGLGYVVK